VNCRARRSQESVVLKKEEKADSSANNAFGMTRRGIPKMFRYFSQVGTGFRVPFAFYGIFLASE
jgi:hypothetical protein